MLNYFLALRAYIPIILPIMFIGIMGCSIDNPTAPAQQDPSNGNMNSKSDSKNVACFNVAEQTGETSIHKPSDLKADIINTPDISKSGCVVMLSWQDNSDNESGFNIKRKTGFYGSWSLVGQVDKEVVSFYDCNLAPNKTYYYRVQAYNSTNRSGYSNKVAVVTKLDDVQQPSN